MYLATDGAMIALIYGTSDTPNTTPMIMGQQRRYYAGSVWRGLLRECAKVASSVDNVDNCRLCIENSHRTLRCMLLNYTHAPWSLSKGIIAWQALRRETGSTQEAEAGGLVKNPYLAPLIQESETRSIVANLARTHIFRKTVVPRSVGNHSVDTSVCYCNKRASSITIVRTDANEKLNPKDR